MVFNNWLSMAMHRFSIIIFIAILGLLTACSIHKIDVQQGNVITQEMMEKLTIGMSKDQVQRLLGTPLIDDPFHSGRWDYIYRYMSGDTDDSQSAHVSLYFKDDKLERIERRTALPKESEVKKPELTRQ